MRICLLVVGLLLLLSSFGEESSNNNTSQAWVEEYTFLTKKIGFCSSKAIDQLELVVELNHTGRKEICHLFSLIDTPSCSKEQKLAINLLLFKMIEQQPIEILDIFLSFPEKLKKKIEFQLKNPLCEKDQLEKAKKALQQIQNEKLEEPKARFLKMLSSTTLSNPVTEKFN